MDYEKKYKQLHKFISDLYPFMSEYCKEKVEGFLPELIESEDEKIRKFLIKWIQDNYYHGTTEIPTKTLIGWLEKQGKAEPKWCHHKVDLSGCSEEYRKAYYDGWNNCNQQHSQCKSEENDVVKCLINGMKFYYEGNEEATWGTEKFPMKVRDILSWLEKQGEQNHFEQDLEMEVKPKFKVGDWVTNGLCTWRIDSINGEMYYGNGVDPGEYFENIDVEYRLWSIQDAKDGDVLAEDTCTFIIKKLNHDLTAEIYCCLYDDGDFELNSNLGFDDTCTYPATKEQRDLLFQKMKEEGYKWDAEKKGLKNIHVIDEGKAEMDYCFTKMMNGEKVSSTWSKEDEEIINGITSYLCTHDSCELDGFNKWYDWLKSLKERITWNPSDEQMDALYEETQKSDRIRDDRIVSLYNDLKKLKGE